MSTKKFPKFLLNNFGVRTSREFKQAKREELRNVQKAMNELMCGAAFLPEYEKYDEARKLLNELQEAMSVKNWGN